MHNSAPEWWNGIHGGFKTRCPRGLRVRVSPPAPISASIGSMKRALLAFLVGLAIVWPGSIFAATPTETVADATVNIYCTYKSGSKRYSSTGSGVFVTHSGTILTNAHVALPLLLETGTGKPASKCDIRTGSPAKATYTAELLYISPDWIRGNLGELKKKRPKGSGEGDFALLYVTGAKKGSALPLSFPALLPEHNVLTENAPVIAAGYPAGDLTYKEVERKLKLVTATTTVTSVRSFTRPHPDVIMLAPSPLARPGVSGGPITTDAGSLLGITAAVDSSSDADRSIRAITLGHVDRLLIEDTGLSLAYTLLAPRAQIASSTDASLGAQLIRDLSKVYLKSR